VSDGVEITRIGDTTDQLGEGLLWDDVAQILYWTDAVQGIVHRLDPVSGERRDHRLPGQIGSLALRRKGGAIVTLENGFYALDLETGETAPLALLDVPEGLRFNDGKVDRQGRIVAGTMHIRPPADGRYLGALYRLDPDGTVELLETDVGNTNGPCFSPDGETFYFADTLRRKIFAYRYRPADGQIRDKRILADVGQFDSGPDGATVDADGFMWSTLFNVGKVVRFDPGGKIDRLIDVPVSHPTNVAFGGRDLDVLYLTSLSKSPNFTGKAPGDGGLFQIHGLGVKGLPEPRFLG
jgi:L-arabinonolactonase